MKLRIRTRVAIIISLIIISFGLLASFFVYYVTQRSLLDEKRQTLLTLVTERAGALSKTMLIGEDVAKLVSDAGLIKNFLADPKIVPDETMNKYLEHFNVRNEFSAIYLMTATGSAVASTDRTFIGNNYGFRNYFKDAVSSGMGREVAVGVTSRQQGFYFSFPVKDETGKVLGVAVAKMRNVPFDEVIRSNESAKLGESLLVDNDGIILFSSKPEWVFRTLAQIGPERLAEIRAERKFEGSPLTPLTYEKAFEAMTAYRSPTVLSIYDRADKREEIISLAKINESKYFLILESGVNEVIRQSLLLSLLIAGFVLLTTMVVIGLVVGFLNRSLRPLDALMKAVRRLGSGDFRANFALKTGDEIEELGNVFNQMVVGLKDSYSDLGKFKLAVDSANSHIILTDPDGKIFYANPAVEAITGYSPKEILGNNPRLWGGLMGKEFYEKMWRQIKEERRPWKGELKNRRKNGEIYSVLSTISPIVDENKNLIGFVGLEDDITAKVQANEALEEEKAKDEAILAGIGDGVIVVDGEGKILLMNTAGEKLMGWKSEEVIGKLYTGVWSVKDRLGNIVAASSRPVQQVLASGKTISSDDYYYTRKDGGDFPAHTSVSPVRREGKVVGAIIVFYDISQEKAVDRVKSEFVSLASHQLRTPLSAVSWYTEMLLSGDLGPVAESQKKYVEEIHESNKRMVELVNALLNVSRIDLGTFAIEPESVNLVDIARSAVAELRPQIVFKKLTFAENYDPGVPVIQADPKLVRIVIGNLVTNAVKYTSGGGRGELGIRLAKMGEIEGGKRLAEEGIMIKVSDSGYGIPQNQQDKVFTKLFRADNVKEKDTEGTGLGLYIVKSIVDAAGGLIWFESVENQGSTFYVFLPLSGMPRKAGAKQLANDVFNRIAGV